MKFGFEEAARAQVEGGCLLEYTTAQVDQTLRARDERRPSEPEGGAAATQHQRGSRGQELRCE